MSPTPYTQAGHRAIGGYGSKEEAGVVVANFKLVQLLINCLAGGNGRPGYPAALPRADAPAKLSK